MARKTGALRRAKNPRPQHAAASRAKERDRKRSRIAANKRFRSFRESTD